MEQIMSCDHVKGDDNYCMKCGFEISSYINFTSSGDFSNHHVHRATKTFTFETELKELNLPDEIKSEIIMLSNLSDTITRKSPRKRILYALACTAYLSKNIDFDPSILAKEFGLTQKDMSEALQLISGIDQKPFSNRDRIIIPMVIISPCQYLEGILKDLKIFYPDINIDPEDLKNKLNIVLEKDKLLLEENPKNVAISMVKYYLESHSMKVTKFNTNFNITSPILKKNIEKIKNVLQTN